MIIFRLAYKHKIARNWALAFSVAIVLISIGVRCGLNASDWSGWVQAAGATIGIGIAIWVPYKQKIEATKAEEANKNIEIYRLKTAIREELIGFYKDFYFPLSEYLTSRSSEMIFNSLVPIYAYNFPVYAAVVGRLTLIPEDHLRMLIGDFYRLAESLLICSRENNRLLDELRKIEATLGYTENWELQQQRGFIYSALQELCGRMRTLIREVPGRARDVADKLEAEPG
jgi:uncharacterized membrane protein YczE